MLLAWAGCATPARPPAATLAPETAAAEFTGRSLRDEDLRRFLAANLGHEPGETWDFETLCWVAFYYHPSLAVARAQWATAQAVQRTAATRPNPTLTLTPGYNFTREPGLSPWLPGINLDFLFPNSGKRARLQDIARAEAEGARIGVLAAAWQVRGELRRSLIETAMASRRASVLRAQADLQARLVTLLEQRVAGGGAATTELLIVRSGRLRAESAAAEALSQSLTSRVRVAAALGLPATALESVMLPPLPTAPALSPETLNAARGEALRSRADILAALGRYRAAHATLELEVAKRVPDFHLGPGYQWDQGANKWSLALSFEIPLFHRNEAPIAEALTRRTEAAAQLTLVQAQAIAAIDLALAAQAAATQQRDRAREFRAELEKQQDLARQRLELGAADQLELQTVQLDVAATEVLLLEAENAAATAAGQLEDALQLPFPHLAALAPVDPSLKRP